MTFTYQTSRLSVVEVFRGTRETDILVSITKLLTPKVVESLPQYFRNINSISDAECWLKKMLPESRLFVVRHTGNNMIIGFVFVFVESNTDAHVGYLLGEPYWGKGYATELLKGLIDFINNENKINLLIAGVATNNIVSSRLLNKLGFIKSDSENNEIVFYKYQLS
ncbi:GNAT family N-acetyltransferase [Psychromonas sp. Urea-02u-13]|uniref:GNAT family N-acetyltransferase n=1 Tax=Psychromonas sp. Urea-02u-13 TaxID=2058326 RepID=UPI0012FE7F99|nr:GNAT family N-acetyltransferase [Psychromonas sp. Urea-02u-13]